jgi:hypothetical protein
MRLMLHFNQRFPCWTLIGASQRFAFRLRDRLALLHGHQRRDLVGTAAQDETV